MSTCFCCLWFFNVLRTVRNSLCVYHLFAVNDFLMSRERLEEQLVYRWSNSKWNWGLRVLDGLQSVQWLRALICAQKKGRMQCKGTAAVLLLDCALFRWTQESGWRDINYPWLLLISIPESWFFREHLFSCNFWQNPSLFCCVFVCKFVSKEITQSDFSFIMMWLPTRKHN